MFTGLHQRWNFALTLEFATEESNALLLYNGRYNNLNDFVAIEIVDRQVVFSVSLGKKKGQEEQVFTVRSFVAGGVSDGQWKTVEVTFSMEVLEFKSHIYKLADKKLPKNGVGLK